MNIVVREIKRAPKLKAESLMELVRSTDVEIVAMNEEIKVLADGYIKNGLIPEKYRDDALHIASAAYYSLDAIVRRRYLFA